MGEVLNSWQVYFPCYCKNSNIGRGQIEVLTFYWFFETKEKASDCFLFKVYAKSILMRRQIIAFRERRRFMRRNCSRRNHFLNSWLMRNNPNDSQFCYTGGLSKKLIYPPSSSGLLLESLWEGESPFWKSYQILFCGHSQRKSNLPSYSSSNSAFGNQVLWILPFYDF